MASGIRATVHFSAAESCPLARFSASAETPIEQVSTSVSLPPAAESVTEFMADAESEPDDVDVRPVFSYGPTELYRLSHDGEDGCPCQLLGRHGCPVHRYTAEDGDLTLVFHAEDFEQLQAVMGAFRDRFEGVDVRRLLQPPLEGSPEEGVFVNRGRLTDRQREVLEAAFERGYFERPKGANATEIADDLGISQSTFAEHLGAAQRKIFADLFEIDE